MADVRGIEVRANGTTLRGTFYDGGGERAIVVASAMAVPRRFYDAFGRFVAESGTSVVTFDYRGVGESRPSSLRGFHATMAEWGRVDLPAVIDWTQREVRPRELVFLGHSAGGQLGPLAPNIDVFSRFVIVTSGTGYWRHWPHVRGIGLALLWRVMPSVARAVGYFPSRAFGLGAQDIPAGVAVEWATWGRHPDYLFAYEGSERHAAIRVPLLAWSFEPDYLAPRPAVEALLGHYTGASIEHRHEKRDGVGHWGFFRKPFGEPLWRETLDWLG